MIETIEKVMNEYKYMIEIYGVDIYIQTVMDVIRRKYEGN
jgi:hypothetical protein